MNQEKLTELINKATSIEKGPPNYDLTENTEIKVFDKEKFATLIIEDCVARLNKEAEKYKVPGREISAQAMIKAATILKTSFSIA